jgi:hypothetical protein
MKARQGSLARRHGCRKQAIARAWQPIGIMRDKAQNVPRRHGHVPSAATIHLRTHSASNRISVMYTCQNIRYSSTKSFLGVTKRGSTGISYADPKPQTPTNWRSPATPARLPFPFRQASVMQHPSPKHVQQPADIEISHDKPGSGEARVPAEALDAGSPELGDAHAVAEVLNPRQPTMPAAHLRNSCYLCCNSHSASRT